MGANFSKSKVAHKSSQKQPQTPPVMTKKQKKAAMWKEVERLEKAIPHMWVDFAIQIALFNLSSPKFPITDDFLLRVVRRGEQIDIYGKDGFAISHLSTNNSKTNFNSLRSLMGDQLFREVLDCGVSWGYFASLYDNIYSDHF